MTLPWLDQPVMLHSSRADTCKLTAEQCEYRSGHWRYWYQSDHVYGLNTVYFFIATIGVCMIGFWSLKLSPAWMRRQSWWQKLVGYVRYAAYKRYQPGTALVGHVPSMGVGFLIMIGIVFFFAMTLGPQPYYWPNTSEVSYGGSPPLATRAGWMATACLPFVIILPTKANMIAKLTGTSHDKLIIFHNWISWAMLVLALVHTFPFIVVHIQKGDMVEEYNTSVVYWTGIVAIIFQAYLTFMSISWIRNRFYEFFKATHFLAAIVFVVFYFIHCDFRLSSWDYFIAVGVLYTFAFLYSQIRTYFEHGLKHRATFTMVSPVTMKVTIPTNSIWAPGQHIFARFLTLGVHAFTAHPFTICSVPNHAQAKSQSQMVFYIKPRQGVTGRLGKVAATHPGTSVPVLLDGPYGGIKSRPLRSYDRSLVVACGSGAGLSLGFVMDWIIQAHVAAEVDGEQKAAKKMQVVMATRDSQLVEWYRDALNDFLDENGLAFPSSVLEILVFRTGSKSSTSLNDSDVAGEKGQPEPSTAAVSPPPSDAGDIPIKQFSGRPDVRNLVREMTLEDGVTVGLVVCGPAGVGKEVQDEAAAAQLRILGTSSGAREVFLHSEMFSW